MDPNASGGLRSYAGHTQVQNGRPYSVSAEMKARQACKIRELAEAVEAAGFVTLDEQAQVLGLPRSTAWTIRRGSHKSSGLSASIINRMWVAPMLPLLVRAKILEYVKEKSAGMYGGSPVQRRRFTARLSIEQLPEIQGV
jgi:hypothetical protein